MTKLNINLVKQLGKLFFGALLTMSIPLSAATYVGSQNCKFCHPVQYSQITNSIHSKMIRTDAHLPGVIHGDLRKPNAPKLPETNAPTNDVHWVIGGWYKEESYIRTNWNGSNITYTVTQFEWDPIKETYSNNKSLRNWLTMCAGCHTTGYNPTNQTFSELNIMCEACHGPASDHLSNPFGVKPVIDRSTEGCGHCHIRAQNVAMGSFTNAQFNFPIGYVLGQPETLRFIPEPLSSTASFFPNGTSSRHRQQYLDMNYPGREPSKHYLNGVTCIKCHNPHTSGIVSVYENGLPTNTYGIKIYDNVNNKTNYVAWDGGKLWNPTNYVNTTNYASITSRELCATCHTDVDNHHVHKFNANALAADVTCVDCHMPDVINVDPKTLRGALHPHRFTAMMPYESIKYGPNAQPNSCTYRCHQGAGADKVARANWADSILTLRLIPLVSADHFKLRLVGTPDYKYAIEASTDLVNWVTIGTNTSSQLPDYAPRWGFELIDTNAASTQYKFFRARQVSP